MNCYFCGNPTENGVALWPAAGSTGVGLIHCGCSTRSCSKVEMSDRSLAERLMDLMETMHYNTVAIQNLVCRVDALEKQLARRATERASDVGSDHRYHHRIVDF